MTTESFNDFVSRGQQSLYQSPQNEIAKLLAQVKQGGGRGQIALRALRSMPGGMEALQAVSAPPEPAPSASSPYTAYPTPPVAPPFQQSEVEMARAMAEARIADPREQGSTFIDPTMDPDALRNVFFGLNPIGGSIVNLLTPRADGQNRVFTPQVPEGFFGSEENLGKLAPFANAAREITSPFDVLTSAAVPFVGPAAAAALRASRAGKAGKVAATLFDPISKGGIGKRVAAETGINLGATLGALQAPKLLSEDAPTWQKVGMAIAGGLVGGGGALVAPRVSRAGLQKAGDVAATVGAAAERAGIPSPVGRVDAAFDEPFKLPSQFARSRISPFFGGQQSNIIFASDFDRALYMATAKATPKTASARANRDTVTTLVRKELQKRGLDPDSMAEIAAPMRRAVQETAQATREFDVPFPEFRFAGETSSSSLIVPRQSAESILPKDFGTAPEGTTITTPEGTRTFDPQGVETVETTARVIDDPPRATDTADDAPFIASQQQKEARAASSGSTREEQLYLANQQRSRDIASVELDGGVRPQDLPPIEESLPNRQGLYPFTKQAPAAARQVTPQQQGGVEVGGRAYSAAERKRLTPNIVSQSQGEFFWESRITDPVDNTVDVAKSAELAPDVAADLPPIIPKSPVAEGAFSTPIGNGKNRPFLESLQDTKIQYSVAFADNLFRKIGEALSPISKYFDPSLAAPESSIGKRLVIVLANLMEEGRTKADRAYTYISRLGTRESIFGAVDGQFKFTEGPFVGRSLNDIVENRAKPAVKKLLEEIKLKETNSETGLPFTALDYANRLADLDEAGSSFARSYGAEVGFSPEDKVLFASRKVYGKVDSEGNVTQIAFDSGDFPRGFVKSQLEEARVYETARQAEADGFVLIPYDETVKLKIAAVYRLAAEESVSKYVFDNYEFAKLPVSKRSIEQKQHELFRGVVGTSRDARALADDFKKAHASHLKKAPESALARFAQGYIQLGRTYELAGDASLFTIQLLFAIMRDLYYPVYKGETGFKLLPSIPLPGGRSTPSIPSIPLPGGRRISTPGALGMKTGKQFAKDFVIGLGSPDRVRQLSAAAIDDARTKLAGTRVIMFQMPGDRTEILEGIGKVEQISNWLEGTARSVPVVGPATGAVAKGLTFPVRRFADAAAEAFGATQNIAGLHLWDAFSPLAKNADGSFDPKRLQDVEDTINDLRGLTSTARLGMSAQQRWWESMALLAPRYRRAVLNLYKNALQGGVRGDVARQSIIAGFAGVHLTFAALLIAKNKSEGKKWDKDLQDSLTPGNSKYFATQAGGAVLGFGGKTISDIRFMAKMLDPKRSAEQHLSDIEKWVRGQVSFIGQDVFTGIKGRSFEGDPVAPWAKKQLGQDEGGWLSPNEYLPNLGKYFAKKPMFIWLQEIALESSSVETKLKVGGTEFIGGRAYEAGKPQLFDEKANELFGKPYADLNMLERHQLKTSSDVAEQLYGYDLESAKRGNSYAAYIVTNNASRNDTQRRTKTALDEFIKNMYDPEQVHTKLSDGSYGSYNGVYSIVNNLRTAVRDAEDEQYISMKEYRKSHGINSYVGKEPTNDFDRMLNAWYELYEKYEKPAGGLQWDDYVPRSSVSGATSPGLVTVQEAFIKKLPPTLAADLKIWRERYVGVPGVQELRDLTFTKRIDEKGREVSLRYGYLNNAVWEVIQNQAGYSSEDIGSASSGDYGPGEPQSYKGQQLPPPLSIYGKPIIKQPAGVFAQ